MHNLLESFYVTTPPRTTTTSTSKRPPTKPSRIDTGFSSTTINLKDAASSFSPRSPTTNTLSAAFSEPNGSGM
ncbi:hypothetical protein HK102_010022, partial [Quaeritorhiza haematococci]